MAPEDDLRRQVEGLTARVATLEEEVLALRENMPAARRPVVMPVQAVADASRQDRELRSGKSATSLEDRIGGQLLNRIGILAVLISVAWFLKMAFDRDWIGPSMRVLTGLLLAGGLMAWSERFRRKGFRAFSYSLKALGTGIAYLSLWAVSSVFHLAPAWLVFLAMTAVTAANAILAWVQTSELLALYALAGGLATPALLSSGLGNEVFLFSYLALLSTGALLLVALRGWSRVAWAALGGTGSYSIGWALSYTQPHPVPMVFFLGLLFFLFASAPFLLARTASAGVRDSLFPVAFPILNAVVTWMALLQAFGGQRDHTARFWVTLALGFANVGLAWRARFARPLSATCLGLGVFLVAAAIPIQFHRPWVLLFWLGESLLLILLADTWAHGALRVFGGVLLIMTGAALLLDLAVGTPQPLPVVMNSHFATAIVAAAVFAAVTVISWRKHPGGSAPFLGWTWLAGFGSVAFSITLLVAVSLEIHHYWFCGAGFLRDACKGYGPFRLRSITAGFELSAWWMVYGAGLMAVGFLRRIAFLRWQALVVLAFSIGKVFLNGVSLENQLYRVLSFLGLGVLLLAVSFAYQKDWLRLRN